jgi:hypothetical protein
VLRLRPPRESIDQWHLVQINGSDVPTSWRVEILRPGGTIVRTQWRGKRLLVADPIATHERLSIVVHYPSGSGATYIRHPFRILVPEVNVPDSDNGSSSSMGSPDQQKSTEQQYRVQAIPALDFGTYGKCAAIWENRKPVARGQLSDSQLKALAIAMGEAEENSGDVRRRPADVERKAARAYFDGEIEDRRYLAWEAAFVTPPLEHYSIRQAIKPAQLSLTGQEETGAAGQLPAEGTSKTESGPGRLGSRGLKRDLLKKSTDPAVLQNLVRAYQDMAIDALAELRDDFGKPRRPFQIQFTYPTRLPTALRNRLANALSQTDLPGPKLGLDEASAVAFFDLLTRIGQRTDLGIAALQAQAATRKGPTLTDRVLVIDVGAGTTDVALIDMRIEDATPDRVGAGEGKGHFWMLSPVVLASGGALTFGADRLTLDVFKALKRRLAESGVRELETAWRDQPADAAKTCWATFVELWAAAEKTKEKALGPFAGSDVTASVTLEDQRYDVDLRWDADVARPAGAFLLRLAALAAGIAKAGLRVIADRTNANPPNSAPRVDRVVLSGQSFASGYLREELEKILRAVFGDDEELNEDFALVAHLQHLKSATAFGAAFAASVGDNESHPNNDDVVKDMQQGLDRFGIKIDALRSNLAAQFSTLRGGPAIGPQTIFERGMPLSREFGRSPAGGPGALDAPRARVRSKRQAVWPTVTIQREDATVVRSTLVQYEQSSEDSTIEWGSFHVTGLEDLVKSRQDLDRAWQDLHATYEIDEDENVSMYLHVGSLPLDLAPGAEFGLLPQDSVSDGKLLHDIFLNAGNQMQKTGSPWLAAGTLLPVVRSVSAAAATATLWAEVPGRQQPLVWTVQENGHRWVSIDEEGRLRSHEFDPPIRRKDHDGTAENTLALLEQISIPESDRYAYRVELEPAGQYDELTDPFSGLQ